MSSNFERALEKGRVGEACIKSRMERGGYCVYRPETPGAHWIDILGVRGKENAVAVDVKTKARMNNLPATGVNQKSFEEYARFSAKYNMPFFIIFVDEHERRIYGNSLTVLERPRLVAGLEYPRVIKTSAGTEIRLWPLEAMKTYGSLDELTASRLRELSQRSYDYAPTDRQQGRT